MKEYDVIVIGSGSGLSIANRGLQRGMKVALIEKGPLGGTCLNVGCIPSKVLIYPADMVAKIREAKKLGIEAKVTNINFQSIMKRMRRIVREGVEHIRKGIRSVRGLDYYEAMGSFVDDYTLEVEGEREKLKGEKIFLVAGARPLIPPIKGIEEIDYLTNETVLELEKQPKSICIVGGGYIAAEYGHFFASMGTDVTIMGRNEYLVPNEEPEISELLKEEMAKRMDVRTNTEVVKVEELGETYKIYGENTKTAGKETVTAEEILIATGRKSNADLLKVENTGVNTDERGYVKVNDYLETSKENIWAAGDITGEHMFKHVANREASLAWHNSIHEEKQKMNYSAIPHAVFSHPQIASVGLTQEEAKKNHEILVGMANYSDVAKGEAMMEEKALAKAILERGSSKILGFHIIGPYAPIVIQEVITVMANEGNIHTLAEAMHIHPALPEIVLEAFSNLRRP